MARNNVQVAQAVTRLGEGTVVQLKLDRNATSPSFGLASVDFAPVPVPDKKYVADVCGVLRTGQVFKIYFGQCPVPDQPLQNLLVMNMSQNGVRTTLAAVGQVSNPTFEEIAKQGNFGAVPLFVPSVAPAQTVTLSANFALTAMASEEAVIDFLKSSPFSIASAFHSSKMAVEPIVRVDLSSGLLLGL